MLKPAALALEKEQLILSTVSPGAAQKRLALTVVNVAGEPARNRSGPEPGNS